jgi:hypothetical protein
MTSKPNPIPPKQTTPTPQKNPAAGPAKPAPAPGKPGEKGMPPKR